MNAAPNLDFAELSQQIEQAARDAFIEQLACAGAVSETLYSFALYSDEGAMTLCPSSNTLEFVEQNAPTKDQTYYRLEPFEWKYEMQGADQQFSQLSKQLYEYCEQVEDDEQLFEQFQQKLYTTGFEVLLKLVQEDFFARTAGREIFVIFSVSEYEFERQKLAEMVTQLNPNNNYKDMYLSWMKSWR